VDRIGRVTVAAVGVLCAAAGVRAQTCNEPAQCQSQFQEAFQISLPTGPIIADNFSPAADGDITGLCVNGMYATPFGPCTSVPDDNFRVRYYQSVNGVPGGLIAEFSQAAGTLQVQPRVATGRLIFGVVPEYAFAATHDAVPVVAGGCYWIEVTNVVSGGGNFCNWHWMQSASGDGEFLLDGSFGNPDGYDPNDIIFGDMTFCLSVPLGPSGSCLPPRAPNEECAGAIDLACGETLQADNSARQPFDSDLPPVYGCGNWSTGGILNSLWYRFVPPGDSAVIEVGGQPGLDSVLAVYTGECGALTEVACNDDYAPLNGLSRLVLRGLNPGQPYYVLLGSYPFTSGGLYTITATCPAPPPPANDSCATPEAIAVGATVTGTNENATHDADAAVQCHAANGPVLGVWYRVTGTGTRILASTCNTLWNFDTDLRVFCADCGELRCVASSTDACGPYAEVSWCSQAGAEYLILVAGARGDTGPFELMVIAEPDPCEGAVECVQVAVCRPDWNQDQVVNSSDISAFLTTWLASVQDGTLEADFNEDQTTNSSDISAFLTAWLAAVTDGC
jgi:hypothetical protein